MGRVLVANNGLAATKFCLSISQSLERPELVGMATEEDLLVNPLYISLVDMFEVIPIGGFTDISRICNVAIKHRCDAVWPGWGHLSENADLAAALESLGITWIGPPSAAMRFLGDKVSAMTAAEAAGVPMIPWSGSHGILKACEALRICNQIGYPVMLKSSCCGGGRGIRKLNDPSEVTSAYDQVSKVTGDQGVIFAMKCAEDCMHVELQVLCDSHGDCRILGARDCSVQRRFQKLVEESPPPLLEPGNFYHLANSVSALFRKVGYIGAGTCEFLFHPETREAFFLEVNCRLQVEHVVTEKLFPGLNLPCAQLAISSGARLSDIPGVPAEHALRGVPGHVVAARVLAEEPVSFRPQTGEISRLVFLPESGYFSIGPGGGEVRSCSDSQLGHLVAWGESREVAISRLRAFLCAVKCDGAVEVDRYCRFVADRILTHPDFVSAGHHTNWLGSALTPVEASPPPAWAIAAAALHLASKNLEISEAKFMDGISRGFPHPVLPAERFNVKFSCDSLRFDLEISRVSENKFILSVGSKVWLNVQWYSGKSNRLVMSGESRFVTVTDNLVIRGCGETWKFQTAGDDPTLLKANSSGKIVQWLIPAGAAVSAGQVVCELECMKMTSGLSVKFPGVLTPLVQAGATISLGKVIGKLELTTATITEETRQKFDITETAEVPDDFCILQDYMNGYAGAPSEAVNAVETLQQFIQEELLPPGDSRILWRAKLNRERRAEAVEKYLLPGATQSQLRILATHPAFKFPGFGNMPTMAALGVTTETENVSPNDLEIVKVNDNAKPAFHCDKLPELFSVACTAAGGEVVKVEQLDDGKCGMRAWLLELSLPSARQVILIANDSKHLLGSFAPPEDKVFVDASSLARKLGIPRIFVACNSGARIGLATQVSERFKVNVKPFFLYLTVEDHAAVADQVTVEPAILPTGEQVFKLTAIFGDNTEYLGCENLSGSAAVAAECARSYDEVVTITLVTGRSVGIGAYAARLCQRVIQLEDAPIILTGCNAMNKLVGSEVYQSNLELGGPEVMHNNGVTHQVVKTEADGVAMILKWLQFCPASRGCPLPRLVCHDTVNRKVLAKASDTRSLLHAKDGLFDDGSFWESQVNWARSVVVGRARLGGVGCGVIAAETAVTEATTLADPADLDSRQMRRVNAGQVWFPDSAYKTAQAIRDFAREELPLFIIANWRGFSGGRRDMFDEILKFGSMIVEELTMYSQPVFVYIPPGGELRGGSWVVLDPAMNPAMIELTADPTARGGVLEPSGTIEVKFRENAMRSLADRSGLSNGSYDSALIYKAALAFADLHDTPDRMKHKGVIRDIVPWEDSREYFFDRLALKLNL